MENYYNKEEFRYISKFTDLTPQNQKKILSLNNIWIQRCYLKYSYTIKILSSENETTVL